MSQRKRRVEGVTRRGFLTASAGTAVLWPGVATAAAEGQPRPAPQQATGVKVGEITPTSALIWTRLTASTTRNATGVVYTGRGKKGVEVTVPVAEIEGACPGQPGRIRVRYGTAPDLADARATDWASATQAGDYARVFALTGLVPGTVYHYAVETTGPGGTPVHAALAGKFETAPPAEAPSHLTFCVMTCQGYPDRDHPEGHNIYPAMLALSPKFVSLTGDVVYYDNDEPQAKTVGLARLHWERMFSLPRQVELLKNVGTYWLKDDHDTLKNDSWPGNKYGLLSFAEGQRIFREQTPIGDVGYRTFRWGQDLQIWLTDGRDYRSPNSQADGPEKTIWGAEQKAWFQQTVLASDATWKVLISPTPLVGPDRAGKNDNHANKGFAHEGNEIRTWIQTHVPGNFFVLCGDRHWQYHSVHPTTGVQEFSVGAASDQHAGGSPGEDRTYHRFHRVKGGFLSVTLQRQGEASEITFRHRDVHGQVVYEWSTRRKVSPRAR